MPIEVLLWIPGVAALVAGGLAGYQVRDKLDRTMGLPSWDFTRSWASNVTVAAGLLTISTLPSLMPAGKPPLTTAGYTGLSVMFTLLAALAPMVFNFSRTVRVRTQGANPPEIISEGGARMFLLAAVLTLWGAIGQLELQVLLMHELQLAGAVPSSIAIFLEAVFSLVAFGLFIYSRRMMVRLVEIQPDGPSAAAARVEAAESAPPPVRWPLL